MVMVHAVETWDCQSEALSWIVESLSEWVESNRVVYEG